MNTNKIKQWLEVGQVVVGPYIGEFYTAGLAGIVASCGADFVIFDYEHSGWGLEALRTQLALARGAGLVPIVNSPGAKFERRDCCSIWVPWGSWCRMCERQAGRRDSRSNTLRAARQSRRCFRDCS